MKKQKEPNLTFAELLADHYDRLTNSEKRIADFIAQNQDEAAFMSATELAERLKLSEPTILRFARSLGFNRYPDFRRIIQARVREMAGHSSRIRSRLDDLRQSGDIYEQLVTSEIDYLTESLHTLDRKSLDLAVDLLHTHQRIFVFGLGPAVALIDQLEIRLTRSTKHVIPLRVSGREMIEPLLLMSNEDLLVAIAFHSIHPSLALVLETAADKGTPVILITDTLGNLLRTKASVVLAARRGPISSFNSLTVPMTIINALLLKLTSVDKERILNNLDQLDQLRKSLEQNNQSGAKKK
jgi:DNA-binding MurR/RpiR family transcriptional regulator